MMKLLFVSSASSVLAFVVKISSVWALRIATCCCVGMECNAALAQTDPPSEIVKFDVEVAVDESLDRAKIHETILVRCGKADVVSLPLHAVPYEDAEIQDLTIDCGAGKQSVELVKDANGLWKAELPIGQPAGSEFEIAVSYQVLGNQPSLILPLVYPPWKPTGSEAELFTALVTFPMDRKLVDSFPTHSTLEAEVGSQKSRRFRMSAIPSMLQLKLASEQDRTMAKAALIDLSVLLVLLVTAIAGWRYRSLLI